MHLLTAPGFFFFTLKMTYFEKEVTRILQTMDYPCRQYPLIQAAKSYIDTNYADPIRLEDLASIACLSKYHFLRLFSAIYPATPHQYLLQVRMREARLLLRSGHSTASACYLSGFNSPGTFRFLFQQHNRYSPSSYRQQRPALRQAQPPCSPFFRYYQNSNI